MYFRNTQHESNFYSFLARAGKSEQCSEPDFLAAIYILSSLAEDHPVIEKCIHPDSINFGLLSRIGTGVTAALIHLAMDVFNPFFWPCRSVQELVHQHDPYYGRIFVNAIKIRHLV